eukprot:1163622-Amphidinium_carterae.1
MCIIVRRLVESAAADLGLQWFVFVLFFATRRMESTGAFPGASIVGLFSLTGHGDEAAAPAVLACV